MGQFFARLTVAHPADPNRAAEVELLVDTGATLSWVPKEALDQIGAPRIGRRSFLVADGRTIERDTAAVILRFNGTSGAVTVVAAEPQDGRLLGATSLETLGLGVDPVVLRLVPRTLMAM